MSTCANCSKLIDDRESSKQLQCDACKQLIHLACTDLRAEDRVTRHKLRGIKILCNNCCSNVESFANLKTLLIDLKDDLQSKIEQIDQKTKLVFNDITERLVHIENRLSTEDQSAPPKIADTVVNEAVDRINRAKNIFVRGVPEITGDIETKKNHDGGILKNILDTVMCNSTPVTFFRIGKPTNSFPRMIKVIMQNEHEAKHILKNKKKLLQNVSLKNVSIIDDKTPNQIECLKKLRKELEERKSSGEENLTIKYIQGVPKIVNFRQ